MSSYVTSMVGNKKLIGPKEVPHIKGSISTENAVSQLVPAGFDDIVTVSIGANNDVVLTLLNAENTFDNTISIPSYVFNPDLHDATFCKFIFQASTMLDMNKVRNKIDYFGTHSYLVLNQNQLLFMAIHHRLTMFKGFAKHYTGLLRKDIAALRNYINFIKPNSYNAKLKVANQYCVLDPFTRTSTIHSLEYKGKYGTNAPYCIGDLIKKDAPQASAVAIKAVLRDLNIHPESESALNDSCIVVATKGQCLYRSIGYNIAKNEKTGQNVLISIFPPKQNMPSRLKTHTTSDCFEACIPVKQHVFRQDTVLIDKQPVSKDNGAMSAIIVFQDMDLHTGRFVFGEVEQTEKLATRQIVKKEIVHTQYKELLAYEGLTSSDGKMILAIDNDDTNICIYGFKTATVTKIIQEESSSSAKIIVECVIEVNNARIISSTGLKGFTKTRKNLGYITLDNGSELNVDLLTGMNAVKAKQNTIVLSRAALALKEGLYTNKTGYLNSLDQKEINEAASHIQKVKYTNEYGEESMVWAGYIEYYVTEIGTMYSKFKPQSFMFEAGKYLQMQKDKELFNFIWTECLDKEMTESAKELYKIVNDVNGLYAMADNLPVYTPTELLSHFHQNDLVLSTQSRWDSDSKLLDEDFNKGFYLDLRTQNAGVYRMPSAALMNSFKGILSNGKHIFPMILVNLSKILQACIVKNTTGQYNIGFIRAREYTEGKRDLLSQYLSEAEGMLFSNEEKGMTLAQSFVKPKIMGINMKQVPDHLVPMDTVVILDERIYHEIQAHIMSMDFENKHLGALALGDKEIYGMAIRNPMLWCTQINVSKIWNAERFTKYLLSIGVDPSKHISLKHTRDCLLISPYLTLLQHGDADGDSLPIFIMQGKGQEYLKNFKLENVTYAEAQWTTEYYHKEFEGNQDLYLEPVYTLHETLMHVDDANLKNYPQFLINAAIAKSTIGKATSDIWTIYAILQMYQGLSSNKETYERYILPWRKKSSFAPKTIHQNEINEISYTYTRLVEEYVINAIKHMEGGSASFEMYSLNKMSEEKNINAVSNKLIHEFGLSAKSCNILIDIVQWSKKNGVMDAVKAFIRKFNKGTELGTINTELFKYVGQFTYFGSLIEPLSKISNSINLSKEYGFDYGITVDSALAGFGEDFLNINPSGDSMFDDLFPEVEFSFG